MTIAPTADLTEGAVAPRGGPWPSPGQAWWGVAMLLLAYTFSYVDRSILTILVEPIQADLHINDTQLALLHGLAFVIFYVTLGLPLGYLADRTHRKWLIAGSVALWSVMTAACGFARSFTQLFVFRVGVGIGEAGLSPAAYSLIADSFPPQRRSAAMGVYTIGIYLGSGLAILAGGELLGSIGARRNVVVPMLGAMRSWQFVFLCVGAPGILLAALTATIVEPARQQNLARSAALAAGGWSGVWRHIRRHARAYGLLTLGFSFLGVPFNVALLWARPYISRHFLVPPAEADRIVGVVMLLVAVSGIVTGSHFCDWLTSRGRRDAPVWTGVIAAGAVLAPALAFPLAPTLPLAVAALCALLFFGAFAYGAAPASLQLITPNRLRATVSAAYLVLVNLVGLTAGPLLTGALTDFVFRDRLAVGWSAGIVAAASAAIALVALVALLEPFRRAVAHEISNESLTE